MRPGRALLLAAAAAALGACSGQSRPATRAVGDPDRGREVIERIGCGGCHVIPGVANATGLVGPPLNRIADRTVIAGVLPNTPDNLRRWLENPQAVVPGNAMPNMELNDHDASDVAAYLYTLH
jgi:cytochrome c2